MPWVPFVLNAIVLVFVSPILEELLFRGLGFKLLLATATRSRCPPCAVRSADAICRLATPDSRLPHADAPVQGECLRVNCRRVRHCGGADSLSGRITLPSLRGASRA